jgi:hypothetical protein
MVDVKFMDLRLKDFILFCIERSSKEWPTIYDEMANVAGQSLFRGLGYAELKEIGLSLSLSDMNRLNQQVGQVVSQNIPQHEEI